MKWLPLLDAVRPCSECGKQPHIKHHVANSGFVVGWIISCENGCYEKYEHDAEKIGRWFQTFPWKELKDAVDEWNTAVECNNGIKQRVLW